MVTYYSSFLLSFFFLFLFLFSDSETGLPFVALTVLKLSVDQAGFRDPHTSTSQVLGIKACATTAWPLLMYSVICTCICMCVHVLSAGRCQSPEVSDFLELELQVVLEIELESSV